MAILVDGGCRIVIQGITGTTGRGLAARALEEGSPLVGGVSPGRGGREVEGVPVFGSCREAVALTGADASFLSVPAPHCLDAALEAIDAGIGTLVVYAEGVPLADAIFMRAFARSRAARLLGPNSAGCVSPGRANLSDLRAAPLAPGQVGIASKSGTLTYEVIAGLEERGLGVSTVACLGGDPVLGTDHAEILELFERDPGTRIVVLVGEIGGRGEIRAAEVVRKMSTPVVAYVAGRHAPPGRAMGHAGALLESEEEAAAPKEVALREAGAVVVPRVTEVGPAVARALASSPNGAGPGSPDGEA